MSRARTIRSTLTLCLLGAGASVGGACGEDEPSVGRAAGPPAGGQGGSGGHGGVGAGGVGAGGSSGGQGGAPTDECTIGEAFCVGHATARRCESTPGGARMVDELCGEGSGCVLGACVPGQCSDECTLGAEQSGAQCELYDVTTGSWVETDQASSLHDRAREYLRFLRRDGMLFGGVGNARYADATYEQVIELDGIGDSAIWTGTYLAAEALRLMVTGAADARDHVRDAVETLHLWLNVAGQPGLLARWVKPSAEPLPYSVSDMDCAAERVHCGVLFEGQSYDYVGHISRDQYQGVMLGYSLAYQALTSEDEPTRALIREDVVELVGELMAERSVPLAVTLNGTALPPFDAEMRFVVLAPAEMDNGAVRLVLDTDDPSSSEMHGFQEFIPDLRDLAGQIPLLGDAIPSLPRPDSAVMLSSFFRVAMQVTDGVAGLEATRAAIVDYYENHPEPGGNVDDWLALARTAYPEQECGNKYYGNNIMMEPMYNLARLEDDAARLGIIRGDVLGGWLWDRFVQTKNSFFSFIYASQVPGHDPAVPIAAAAQLAGFPLAPRAQRLVDLRADPAYLPHEEGCADQCNHATAVDVATRVWADFMWQRHPWGLYVPEDLPKTAPGIDYLVAYWLGRFHGFVADDGAGRCAAWR